MTGVKDVAIPVSPAYLLTCLPSHLLTCLTCLPSPLLTCLTCLPVLHKVLFVPGSVLVLKDDTIRTYGQRFARTAAGNVTVTSPSNPVTPRAVLTGPDVVSSCTKSFSVDGRRSTGLGGRPGNYSWLVDPSFGLSLGKLP